MRSTPTQTRLSCQRCQIKKIKCDRETPCAHCTKVGQQCVPTKRRTRRLAAGGESTDYDLRERVAQLEDLVNAMREQPTPSLVGRDALATSESSSESPATRDYIGNPVWSFLINETEDLKAALEDEPLPLDPDTDVLQKNVSDPSLEVDRTASGPGIFVGCDLILQPPGTTHAVPGALPEPSSPISRTLCLTFCRNVDCLFKVFHTPSLKSFMIDGASYLGYEHNAPCNKAVKAAVWFAAISSMTEGQCQVIFSRGRSDQIQIQRRVVEVALAQADMLNSDALPTFQALITFLGAARLTDPSRRLWGLVGLAVRLAYGLGLDSEATKRPPFETELRRRAWNQIRLLDVYVGLDRNSRLLIDNDSFDTQPPSNLNDAEINQTTAEVPVHDFGFTETTFARLLSDACSFTHQLVVPEISPNGKTWQQRVEVAQQFGKLAHKDYFQYCDDSIPFQRLVKGVGKTIHATLLLRAVRPMQKYLSSVPPPVGSPFTLQLAVNCLRASENVSKDPELQNLKGMVWVQWYAVAVVAAGLCSVRGTSLAEEAWVHLDSAMERSKRHIADTSNGMLWRPIEKVYRKAKMFKLEGKLCQSDSFNEGHSTTALNNTTQNMEAGEVVDVEPSANAGSFEVPSSYTNTEGELDWALQLEQSAAWDPMLFHGSDLGWLEFEPAFQDTLSAPDNVRNGHRLDSLWN